jgi:hypothetical protein
MKNKKEKSLQSIYNKYRNGDLLTNKEIEIGIERLSILCELLSDMGPVMFLAWKECNRILMGLEDFKKARQNKK